jgi:signal transduction histidine kinase
LLLGLGLVVGIIAILLAGTQEGLSSYIKTMKTIDSKLSELQLAEELRTSIASLTLVAESDTGDRQKRRIEANVKAARDALNNYEARWHDTVQRQRDPDEGYQEKGLLEDLHAGLDQFGKAIENYYRPRVVDGPHTAGVGDDPGVKLAYVKLARYADELRKAIYDDLYLRITQAKQHYRRSLIIVISASVIGIGLMGCLVYFFYGWVFHPIRKLQAGVQRVTAGDFDQPIDLKSGDELEELAVAFDNMTRHLRDMYRDLARQVNERSRQLVRSERMVSVGFLAAGVAHEINNPLASIAFCGEALERRLHDLLARQPQESETATKYLRMIQQEAFRCKAITQRLLEFSRVGERRREPTDLAELIASVLEIAQHLQNCKGKRIVFQPATRLRAVCNGQDIKSVVLNLVVNALDSMDEGGTLTIHLNQRGALAELVFIDSGCGMAGEVLENIFEPFFTRSRTGKGTGLGLFISHQIIDQHGGEIRAASPGQGQGSTFTVLVPLQPAESAAQVPMAGPAWAADGPATLSHPAMKDAPGSNRQPREDGFGHAAA